MAGKAVRVNVDKRAKIEYPRATVCANIVPAMRTPDDSFPLLVEVLKTEKQEDGTVAIAQDADGNMIVAKAILERYSPDDKETVCALKGSYHQTWLYTIGHGIVAWTQGNNVKGRVFATTFAHNYSREELSMKQLFEATGYILRVTMETGRSLPATMGSEYSVWIMPIINIAQYSNALATATILADSMTEQVPEAIAVEQGPAEIIEFEL